MHERIDHPLPPLFNAESKILILGSFPSVKTRAARFPYGHPQNRFWPLLSHLLGVEPAMSAKEPERATSILLRHEIALWDSIASCEIVGSSDSSIRNVVAQDLSPIFEAANIRHVFCNGNASFRYYKQYQKRYRHIPVSALPSTSPANARMSLQDLSEKWQVILDALE